MNFFNRILNAIIENRKQEALRYLQSFPPQQLADQGFSKTQMDKGVSGWPWRKDDNVNSEVTNLPTRAEEKKYVDELRRCSDSELADLGITRGTIRQAVRYGRYGLDGLDQREAA